MEAGSPARSSKGFHERLCTLWMLMGLPALVGKTYSEMRCLTVMRQRSLNAATASPEWCSVLLPAAVFGGSRRR